MIQLEAKHKDIVDRILKQYLPERTVYVFGSRATGKASRYSDLDLFVEGSLDRLTRSELQEAFSESDLPTFVDVIDEASTDEGFCALIEKEKQKWVFSS